MTQEIDVDLIFPVFSVVVSKEEIEKIRENPDAFPWIFKPINIFRLKSPYKGYKYFCIDGHHRLLIHKLLGIKKIKANIGGTWSLKMFKSRWGLK